MTATSVPPVAGSTSTTPATPPAAASSAAPGSTSTATAAQPAQGDPAATPAGKAAQATEPAKPSQQTTPKLTASDYKLTVPEGLPGKVFNANVLGTLASQAAELGIAPDVAQKLVASVFPAIHQQGLAEHAATRSEWVAQFKAHPTIGGANVERTLERVDEALDRVGDPKLRELLTGPLGLVDHPAIAGLMHWIWERITPDSRFVSSLAKGASAPSGDAEIATKFYPNTPKA